MKSRRHTLHIVVCTKHTPDSEARMSVDEAGIVSWGESPLIINPWDEYAVEEALELRDQHGGRRSSPPAGGHSRCPLPTPVEMDR